MYILYFIIWFFTRLICFWKTFLFYDGSPWTKKDGNEDFDIPMGCFHGAECCDLVGAIYTGGIYSTLA